MKIEPIFILFALFLVLLLFFRESKTKAILIYVSFVLIFVMSRCGADYGSYQRYYESEFSFITIEPLYMAISNLFHKIGLPYEQFRLIWLASWLALLCYSLYHMTNRYTLAFLILYLGYLQYLLAAYRQFAAIAISFWCFYQLYFKKRAILPLLAAIAACYIHKGGYIILIWVAPSSLALIAAFIYRKVKGKALSFDKAFGFIDRVLKKYGLVLLLLCCVLRVFVYYATDIPFVYNVLAGIIGKDYMGKTLVGSGFLSRFAIMFLFLWMYRYAVPKKKYTPIVLFYVLCMFGYLILPYETFSGRLFNHGRIFDVILIPYLFDAMYPFDKAEKKYLMNVQGGTYVCSSKVFLWAFLALYALMFYSQMTTQSGYTPYVNVYFDAIFSWFGG